MTNDELQALAEELSSLEPETDGERARTIEAAIADYELSLLKNRGGKAYFPLLKKHNGAMPFEEFYDIFIDVLLSLLRKYDSAKNNSFRNALGFLLNLRINGYWNEHYKEREAISLSDMGNSDNDEEDQAFEIPDETYNPDRKFGERNAFELFLLLAPLVALRKKQEQHLSKSKKSYFEGFFTFDATAQTKSGLFDEADVISENDALFPIMEDVVLEHLLDGRFTCMRDIVKNKVKDPKRLEQRNDVMQTCYGLAKPTVVKRNKLYRQLFAAASDSMPIAK